MSDNWIEFGWPAWHTVSGWTHDNRIHIGNVKGPLEVSSIRIYDRALTSDERVHNLDVDRLRYLGESLSLTNESIDVAFLVSCGLPTEPIELPSFWPTVNGVATSYEMVFEVANSRAPIHFPQTPIVSGVIGAQIIDVASRTLVVPSHYTAQVNPDDSREVVLELNEMARPLVAAGEDGVSAITVDSDRILVNVSNVIPGLHYGYRCYEDLRGLPDVRSLKSQMIQIICTDELQ